MILRIIHITLSVFLFFSSSGMPVNSHFCTGDYKYSSLFTQPKNCCAKVQGHFHTENSIDDEANQTPCCQNKSTFSKALQSQNLTVNSSANIPPSPSVALLPVCFFLIKNNNGLILTTLITSHHS